ncbi:MAG: type 1 glutamine amidotransferase domain-containing protein [Parasphingopyxis sp.]|uniref:type 1 glutamine amidotransferase domain-containing protein n=1 Tax=Parasphingopyxis sp. TaxID=1920299 RepID=UPI003F9F585B
MTKTINGANILILASDGFEYSELTEPRDRLIELGANVTLAAPSTDPITGESGGETKGEITPDTTLDTPDAEDYDALLLPGGQRNPDNLRMKEDAIALIKAFADQGKPIAAICHAPWLLVEADLLRGRTATSWPSLRTDLRNAGANVVDREVAVDGNIITSRNPDDIPAFTQALVDAIETADQTAEAA